MNETQIPIVKKIMNKYIIGDTAQIMEGYKSTMSVISNSGIIFNARGIEPKDIEINTYLTDERREDFPYSDKPIHYSKKFLREKLLYINMLLRINKPHLVIKSGIPFVCYVSEINGKFVLITKPLCLSNCNRDYINEEKRRKLLDNLMTCEDNQKLYIIDAFGRQINLSASQEEKHKNFLEFLDYLDENNIKYEYDGATVNFHVLWDEVIDKAPITSIIDETTTYFIKVDGKNIKVKSYEEKPTGKDYWRIKTSDVEIDSLESILAKITEPIEYLGEPVISKRLNRKLKI